MIRAYLGIYPEEIDRADDICSNVLEYIGLDRNAFEENVEYRLSDEMNLNFENITNEIIAAMFCELYVQIAKRLEVESDEALRKKIGSIDNVRYYVNGWDSHFSINGDEF